MNNKLIIVFVLKALFLGLVFGLFIARLMKLGVKEAIYLDMGGWKYSWYRDAQGKAIDIYPNPNKYATNWITFYKL